ncbi:MAG: SGNH/GDSL hydrolase family protein [Chitinophagales bacterium]|nr:SGNH/GDSL hydrolase family protein [Chitinophagales bacterium]
MGALFFKLNKKGSEKFIVFKTWLQKSKNEIVNGLLLAVSLFISIASVEWFVRHQFADLKLYTEQNGEKGDFSMYSTRYFQGWLCIYPPNFTAVHQKREFTRYIKSNKQGLNDHEFKLEKDSAIRIMAFGDSFTEGIGSIGDSSYPKILQSIMPNTEVLGCGISGSDPVFCYKLLEQKLAAYKPDIATFTINISDQNEIFVRRGFDRFQADGTLKFKDTPWWDYWFKNFFIMRYVAIKIMHYDFFFRPFADVERDNYNSRRVIETAMDSIQHLCTGLHIRPVFIFHPLKVEIDRGVMDCADIMPYAQKKGCETIDMFAYFKSRGLNAGNAGDYYWQIDLHHNNKGYALFAEAIRDYLERTKSDSKNEHPYITSVP